MFMKIHSMLNFERMVANMWLHHFARWLLFTIFGINADDEEEIEELTKQKYINFQWASNNYKYN